MPMRSVICATLQIETAIFKDEASGADSLQIAATCGNPLLSIARNHPASHRDFFEASVCRTDTVFQKHQRVVPCIQKWKNKDY